MTKVLVVHGSRHGGTRGIAERIGEVLRTEGAEAVVAAADHVAPEDVRGADAFVIGSGVYMGSWLREPLEFMRHHAEVLASRPTWLFSSGPLLGSSKEQPDADPVTNALGPADGPGSGGRKRVEELSARIRPLGHRVFPGTFDPKDPPRTISEGFVRLLPAARKVLPPGDFRDWAAIEAWAHEIAAGWTRRYPSRDARRRPPEGRADARASAGCCRGVRRGELLHELYHPRARRRSGLGPIEGLLTRFQRTLAELSIRHVRTQIDTPWTNGKAEAFWATLQAEVLDRQYLSDLAEAEAAVTAYATYDDYHRLHGAIAWRTPAERFDGTPFTDRGFEHVPSLAPVADLLAELLAA